ncbi:uncharacterized protein LOC132729533 [Ruditapes philippinarum]|uniref:uncharacterized protein LOC132729533 n=1 Tax=Ruditapes philippinarum TaxID=129788 RepID=UPI00295A94BE|nr:uncharacterized protein LOC132729533 [Ruditapes philippinarum]
MAEEDKTGCFAWCVRAKQACNKRWARTMNRLRRRFYARRGQRVDPETDLDEAGARDMVLSKNYIDIPDMFAAKDTVTADDCVARLLQAAAEKLASEAQLLNNRNVIQMDADDNISTTSSVTSRKLLPDSLLICFFLQ